MLKSIEFFLFSFFSFVFFCGCSKPDIPEPTPFSVPPAFETEVDLMEYLKDQFWEEKVYCVMMKNGREWVDYKHPVGDYLCSWMMLGDKNQSVPASRRIHYIRTENYSRYYFTLYDFRDAEKPLSWQPPTWKSDYFYRADFMAYEYRQDRQVLHFSPDDKEMLVEGLTTNLWLQLNKIDVGSERNSATVTFDARLKESCADRFPIGTVGIRVVWTKLWNMDVGELIGQYKPWKAIVPDE